ncbi:hypothetical protein D6779_10340 [Candidatus Parcubacteria bacterium]|nr:MAG: hypothetical protein D6779_10340 [Candidatus Parcubacteria bacterium]
MSAARVPSVVPSLVCCYPDCGKQLAPESAFVPGFKHISKLLGRKVLSSDLQQHTYCREHSRAAKEAGIAVYPFQMALQNLLQREEQEKQARRFFQLKYALEEAGVSAKSQNDIQHDTKNSEEEEMELGE